MRFWSKHCTLQQEPFISWSVFSWKSLPFTQNTTWSPSIEDKKENSLCSSHWQRNATEVEKTQKCRQNEKKNSKHQTSQKMFSTKIKWENSCKENKNKNGWTLMNLHRMKLSLCLHNMKPLFQFKATGENQVSCTSCQMEANEFQKTTKITMFVKNLQWFWILDCLI